MASISLKFFELIDLAVGVPNANAINVNMLHTILQVIASQVGIQNHKIDFEGDDAKKVQKIKNAAPIGVELVNYRVADQQETKLTESAAALQKQMQTDAKRPVKMVEFRMLENKVRMMATHVEAITMLPPTDEIIEQLRTNPDMKPVSEMVHKVALTKRVSALEEEIDKIASLVERTFKELTSVKVSFQQQFPGIKLDISDSDMPVVSSLEQTRSPTTELPPRKSLILDAVPEMKEMLNNLTNRVEELSYAVENLGKTKLEGKEPSEDVKHSITTVDYTGVAGGGRDENFERDQNKRMLVVEKLLQTNESKVKYMEQTYKVELQALQEEIRQVEVDFNAWVQRLTESLGEDFLTGKRMSVMSANRDSMMMTELSASLSLLQQEVTEMAASLQNLVIDNERKNESMRKLRIALDKMETTKLDKETLEDSLAGKADTTIVNRKVSYEQFDITCNEFSSSLNNTVKKISDQEVQWVNVIEEIHTHLKNKLDRNEISPLKDFINYRLKLLQDKLKAVLNEKLETEGAGTKKQLMKDLRCISCDKSVMQKVHKSPSKGSGLFPMSKSVKPYLTYELDQIRRQERQLPLTRNLNEFNKVLKETERSAKKNQPGAGDIKVDHLCNRYCGGSHTIISPTQRVAKAGHYTENWGLKVLPYGSKDDDDEDEDTDLLEKTTTVDENALPLQAEQEKM